MKKVLKDLACDDAELSILFTDDRHISQLNSHYLGRDGPTNVLAFPMTQGPSPDIESPMLGDVVVSVDTAIRESENLGEPLAETICRLLIHGILHLLHYDHEGSSEKVERMEKEEARLFALIKKDL
jgi:probable rRNA maturation factor